jgi:uncharacterized protein (TIGR04255 family)
MHYNHNFLREVIFQANFNIESLDSDINQGLVDLCEEITKVKVSRQSNTILRIGMANQSNAVVKTTKWVFRNSKVIQIVIQGDMLQIVSYSYKEHESFHNIIDQVFNRIKEVYKPIFSRIALRYINNINLNEGGTFDFSNYINNSLLNATFDFRDFGLTRSIGNMNLRDDREDILTNFTYGFVNSEFPNFIAKREFILDFDCYTMMKVTIDAIKPIILRLRDKANQLFEKSIRQEFRDKLNLN